MKIINIVIEIITAPFALLLRLSSNKKNYFSSLAKPVFVFAISLLIVVLIVLFYYRDFIF
ncbi:MAG TPA: hypothetical protein IAD46_01570 [Candidatus Pelethenecus faecipullorum]|uniref:Uncharacterized protein n=1 Tax=Candidatus Pelethenecus faecipullorum TaxID=2840900 RepID=A0A9D1GQP4_9MOLU|nr:hypothetical protein [Candidatus Pelethenecus faecipullorum]